MDAAVPCVRSEWIALAERLAGPVLRRLAARTLRATMPVESPPGSDRSSWAHLEAVGRLLAGLGPWLETGEPAARPWAELAREAITAITDPDSPDYGNFVTGNQPLVDTAFLAQAILRAPQALWVDLDPAAQSQIIAALKSTRRILPYFNNWLLFSAMVEAALHRIGEADWDCVRVVSALRQHEQWYLGDGVYGDGPAFHADYYNAFVIHPMLIDILRAVPEDVVEGNAGRLWARARRFAEIQERTISPEGTFPPLGRSIAYRCGALQGLAQMALLRELPETVSPAQARGALTAVLRRTLGAPNTFDADGWLRIGLAGAQPELAENYISTGSLYLCAAGLLPLGLPAEDPFWSAPDVPWTACLAWSGAPFPRDAALKG